MSAPSLYGDDDLDFMPDIHRAANRRGRKYAYILSAVAFLFFLTFIVWSHFAILDEVTRGEGKVIPSSKTKIIQNLEGGILAEILVREGDIVNEGDILVRIDNTVARASLEDLTAQRWTLKATIARLEATLADAKSVTFSEDVLAGSPEDVEAQTATFTARKNQTDSQIAVLKSQVDQRRAEINEAASRRNQLVSSLELARQEQRITSDLVSKQLMAQIELIRVNREVANLQGELNTVKASITKFQTGLKESEQRVQELINSSKATASDELNLARAELHSVESQLGASEDRVTRTEVRSIVRGTVKELKFNTEGGVIPPGADIIEIVPLEDSLLIEAQVRPADIAFLSPGQSAMIKISAYDFSIYGGLEAKLEHISADTIKDEQGESFYRVYLRTEKSSLKRKGEEHPIIPGMTATAEILTGEKSVMDYMLKPILKARDRALTER